MNDQKNLILGIHGSPREGGNSDILLGECLQGARSAGAGTQTIRAAALQIGGCRNCGSCQTTGECVFTDDMQKVYPLLDAASRVVISTPIFFYSFPAQLKALIDRAQARWSRRQLTKSAEQRKHYDSGHGYLLAVGATRGKNLFEGVELTARYFYDALDMQYCGGVFFRGVDEKGAIREKSEALSRARELGRRIAGDVTGCVTIP